MKLRLKDSSFRFRITLSELEALERQGSLSIEARFPTPQGEGRLFQYGVRIDPTASRGTLRIDSASVFLILCEQELQKLGNPEVEGIYLREEWTDEERQTRRSFAFIEKDKPSSNCEKPEAWIYEDPGRGKETTVPRRPDETGRP